MLCKRAGGGIVNGLLVRVGCDQTAGGGRWNGPIDLRSGRFVYVPIPEGKPNRLGFETPYSQILPVLESHGMELPEPLATRRMHLDPDFSHLTYGDRGRKGKQISNYLIGGDLLAFYSALKDRGSGSLIYALIGLIIIDRIERAADVAPPYWDRNAHTRRELGADADDIVVVGQKESSGRLERALIIGEFRDRAYRVTQPLLQAWGDISARDGYVQRSAIFPRLLDANRFLEWFRAQGVALVHENNCR